MRRYGRTIRYVSLSVAIALSAVACKRSSSPDSTNNGGQQTAQQYPGQDPAAANLAPVSDATDNTGAPSGAYQTPEAQQRHTTYSNQPDPYAAPYSSDANYDPNYTDYENPVEYAPQPPPELPEYQQPPCPGDNYIWTPGYWNYDSGQGYYWVPGAWVLAPYTGALWTPGWWGYDNGRYGFHRGFWGHHVGYYGGINYGYGYDGYGYQRGYWHGDHFAYNRVANNVEPSREHDVYDYRYRPENNTRVSYNGGRGVQIRPRPAEITALHEAHNAPLAPQMQLAQEARSNRQNFAKLDHGRPAQPVAQQPLRAENNIQPPPVRNPGAIPPERRYPGQPRNVPPPQPGHYVTNVEPQPGGPRVGEQTRAGSGAYNNNANRNQEQGSGKLIHENGPNGIPVHAVGPEPAVPHAQVNYQPKAPEPYRPEPAPSRGGPDHRANQTRTTSQSRPQPHPESQRPTPNGPPSTQRSEPGRTREPAQSERPQTQHAHSDNKPERKPEEKRPQ